MTLFLCLTLNVFCVKFVAHFQALIVDNYGILALFQVSNADSFGILVCLQVSIAEFFWYFSTHEPMTSSIPSRHSTNCATNSLKYFCVKIHSTQFRRRYTGDVRQETWDRKRETGDVGQEMWDKICETGEIWDGRRHTRHDTGGMIEETWYKRQDPFFPLLTTKHWHTKLKWSNRNVCDDHKEKSVLNYTQNCLWLIKNTFLCDQSQTSQW